MKNAVLILILPLMLVACDNGDTVAPLSPPQPVALTRDVPDNSSPNISPVPQPPTAPLNIQDLDRTLNIELGVNGTIDTIVRRADGMYFIGGNTQHTFDTHSKTESAFVAQLDSSGNIIWADLVDSTPYSSIFKITFDKAGNLLAAGSSGGLGGKALIAKYELSGSKFSRVWSHSFGTFSICRDIVTDQAGNIYVGGYSTDKMFYSKHVGKEGRYNSFVSKFDTDGNEKWTRLFVGSLGEASEVMSLAIVQSPASQNAEIYAASIDMGEGYKYYVHAGHGAVSIQKFAGEDGRSLWEQEIEPGNDYDVLFPTQLLVQPDTDGTAVLLCGEANNGVKNDLFNLPARRDHFLAKFFEKSVDNSVSQMWLKYNENASNGFIQGCATGADNSVHVVSVRDRVFQLLKYDEAGNIIGNTSVRPEQEFLMSPEAILFDSDPEHIYFLGIFPPRGAGIFPRSERKDYSAGISRQLIK